MVSSEGDQAGAIHAIMDKIEADILPIVELDVNLHTPRIFFQKDSSYKCQFCTKICANVWVKYEDVPTKILKRDSRTNSS